MKKSSSDNILNLTIKDLSKLISTREISPVDLVETALERIAKLNPTLNAFITVLEDSARQDAKNAELLIKEGKYRGPLHGIPISLKDLIYVKGVKSTSGSKILSNFIPEYDSTVVKKLKDAGAIVVGMNNTHEFACGITNINPHYGSSKNPWDINRISGGSSGGSAVAVSAGMTPASIGTDTSGSIRVPSSLCGLFGLKPTYGRVSKYGVQELAPSIDHIGPIARSTWDIAAVLQTIAGYDKLDNSIRKSNRVRCVRHHVASPEEGVSGETTNRPKARGRCCDDRVRAHRSRVHADRRRHARLRAAALLLDRDEPRRERDGALGRRRPESVRPGPDAPGERAEPCDQRVRGQRRRVHRLSREGLGRRERRAG